MFADDLFHSRHLIIPSRTKDYMPYQIVALCCCEIYTVLIYF